MKVMTGAGVAGTVWKQPVVNAVLLPAHAALSGDLYSDDIDLVDLGSFFQPDSSGIVDSLVDTLVPSAMADHDIDGTDTLIICVAVSGENFSITVHRIEESCSENTLHVLYSGAGTLGVETGNLSIESSRLQEPSEQPLLPVRALVSNLVPGVSVDVRISNTGECESCDFDFTLPISAECPTSPFTPGTYSCDGD